MPVRNQQSQLIACKLFVKVPGCDGIHWVEGKASCFLIARIEYSIHAPGVKAGYHILNVIDACSVDLVIDRVALEYK